MEVCKEYKYTGTHEWVQFLDENTVLMGITDFAQDALGDLVFLSVLITKGDNVVCGEAYAEAESIKAVSPIYSLVGGTLAEINYGVVDNPQKLNESPYESWLVKITDITDTIEDLMSAEEYEEFCQRQNWQ